MSKVSRALARAGVVIAVVAISASPIGAQQQIGTVSVLVMHDSMPVQRSFVRAGPAAVQTNAEGRASLVLPAGLHAIVASRLGLRPDTVMLTVRVGMDTSVVFELMEQPAVVERVVVSATRTERRIEDVPLRVEVLAREEVEEKMLMTPGDISMMLNETGGLRVQTTSPSLGAANVRMQGLRGRYTLMLADGLPLYGGQSGTLGLLQIPPMDLGQVEVIKGVASALYGCSALGGVVNLVSRRPEEAAQRELLINQTTRNGTDAVLWLSEMLSERWGYTVLTSGHRQSAVDVDRDRWTDLPAYERVVIRPRLFWSGERGRNAMVTVGGTLESRQGGTLHGGTAPDGLPFVEALDTKRFDVGTVVRLPFGSSVFSMRSSAASQRHGHQFGPVPERDEHVAAFGEASVATTRGVHTGVAGIALQMERYDSRDVTRFNHRYTIPAAFAQWDVDAREWLALSVSGRVDAHSEYGIAFNPRVSVLVRVPRGWTARLSGGTGVFAPTPFTEQTEAAGLVPLRALPDLAPERAASTSLDIGGSLGPFELNATAFASRITSALIVRSVDSSPSELEMLNATLPTRTVGADILARYRLGDLTTTLTYTRVRSTEQSPEGGSRRIVPLAPNHAAGLVSVWETEGVQRVGLEAYYTGAQELEDNPYLARSRPYVVFGAIAERRIGRARLFLNFENIGNARMTKYQRLVRPAPGDGGRWTTDAWGPLEGRTINGGVRLDFGGVREDE